MKKSAKTKKPVMSAKYAKKLIQRPQSAWATRIRRFRDSRKLTNRALAKRLKMSVWTIWMWVHGVFPPSEKNQARLKALGA